MGKFKNENGKDQPFMSNIQWQSFKLTESDRAKIKNQQPLCLWMTGLSGAGKSTLANALEEKLNRSANIPTSWTATTSGGLNQDLVSVWRLEMKTSAAQLSGADGRRRADCDRGIDLPTQGRAGSCL